MKNIRSFEEMNILPYFMAFFKYVIYGSSVFFTSELEKNVDVIDILALRFLMSFVVMWMLKTLRVIKIDVGIRAFIKKNPRTPFMRSLFLAAMFEPVLYMFFEAFGISMTTNITTAVVLSLAPIVSCIAEALILKEKNTVLQKIFLAVGIVGVLYIALMTDTGDGENSALGILFLFLAITSGALFAVFSRKSSKAFSSMEITYVSCVLGAVVFNTVNVVRHLIFGDITAYFSPYYNVKNMIGFLFLGVLSTIVATGMNNYALSKMQVSSMAAFSGVSTMVTIIIGVFFRSESLYYYHYIGLSLIITRMIGVSAISIVKDKKRTIDESKKRRKKAVQKL